jgi:hypothetical protein
MKSAESNPGEPFVLMDLMGEEVKKGDTIAVAALQYNSPQLFIGLVTEIKRCKKTARCYFTKIGTNGSWKYTTYFSVPLEQNGSPSSIFIKLSGIEFGLNQKRFATLFSVKSEFDASNPKSEEAEDD